MPRPDLELPFGLRDEHGQAVERVAAGRRGLAQQPGLARVVDEVVDETAVEPRARPGVSSTRGCMPADDALTRRSQLTRHRRQRRRGDADSAATRRAASFSTRGDRSRARRRRPARWRRPAPRRRRRESSRGSRRSAIRPSSGARNRRHRCCARASGRPRRARVFTAPTRDASASGSQNGSRSTLNGSVTLAPSRPNASANASRSSASAAWSGR